MEFPSDSSVWSPDSWVVEVEESTRIALAQDRDIYAVVDIDAIPILAGRTWSLSHCGKGKYYAKQIWCKEQKRNVNIYMHRLLALHFIGPPPRPDMVVDHKDGDGLNNRRANFRWLDAYENRWLDAYENRWLHARHKR